HDAEVQHVLVSALVPRDDPGYSELRERRLLQQTHGDLLLNDWRTLVSRLRREDRPIRFYERLDGVAGIHNPGGPPSDAVRLANVIRLSRISAYDPRASVERGKPATVSAFPGMGAYAATIPISGTDRLDIPCWIQVRARVVKGRAAFGVYNRHVQNFLAEPV